MFPVMRPEHLVKALYTYGRLTIYHLPNTVTMTKRFGVLFVFNLKRVTEFFTEYHIDPRG